MCDHDFKIIATRELRQYVSGLANAGSFHWDMRVCLSCGQFEAKHLDIDNSEWELRYEGSMTHKGPDLQNRVQILIHSIKGDAQ